MSVVFFLLKMSLGFYKPWKISLKVPKKIISELAVQNFVLWIVFVLIVWKYLRQSQLYYSVTKVGRYCQHFHNSWFYVITTGPNIYPTNDCQLGSDCFLALKQSQQSESLELRIFVMYKFSAPDNVTIFLWWFLHS